MGAFYRKTGAEWKGRKKYQVFVSSTYEDLQKERQRVMHALLELDCIPSGMELFPAANEDQWSLIKRVIEECDYFIVISAGRYGSLAPDGRGYTEKEFDHAVEVGKPVISFLHKNLEDLPHKYCEKAPERREALGKFHEKLKKKMCKFWSTPDDLRAVVSSSLVKLIKDYPAIGWIRGDEASREKVMRETAPLRFQVQQLERDLELARTTVPESAKRVVAELLEEKQRLQFRLENMQDEREKLEQLQVREGAYYCQNGDGPFCIPCWDRDHKLMRMTGDGTLRCHTCKYEFMTQEYKEEVERQVKEHNRRNSDPWGGYSGW